MAAPPPPLPPATMAEIRFQFNILHQICLAVLVLVPAAFALRLVSRTYMLRVFRKDDAALTVAFICFIGYVATVTLHVEEFYLAEKGDFSVFANVPKIALAENLLYAVSAAACKISMAFLVLGLLGPHSKAHYWIVLVTIGAFTINATIYFAFSFTCGMRTLRDEGRATCKAYDAAIGVSKFLAVLSVITDIVFTALCVSLIYRLKISYRARLVSSALLMLTSAGAIASIIRVAVLYGWGWTYHDGFSILNLRWCVVENAICIFGLSLSACRPILSKLMPSSATDAGSYGVSGMKSGTHQTGGGGEITVATLVKREVDENGDEVPLKPLIQHSITAV